MPADQLVQRRKEDGIFAGFVRTIHANERRHGRSHRGQIFGFCGSGDAFRESTSHGMLRPQVHRQFDQVVRLLKTGEYPGFFDLLVVILDESGNERRGFPHDFGVEAFPGLNAPACFVINQQNPIEYSMLAHEVFVGGNILILFFFPLGGLRAGGLLSGFLPGGRLQRFNQSGGYQSGGSGQKNTARFLHEFRPFLSSKVNIIMPAPGKSKSAL